MIAIKSTVRVRMRQIPFEKISRAVLPARYDLSLVICSDSLTQKMNAKYRKKSYVPNVLAFSLAKNEGEIFLNIRKAAREARGLGISTRDRIAHLLVHALFHLRGQRHGKQMEAQEDRILRRFGFRAVR